MRFAISAIAAGVLCAASLVAQTDRGTISGVVTDSSGATIPEASVTAVQTGTNSSFSTITTATGDFTIPSLPVGDYAVRVEKQGFKAYVASGVKITAGGTARVAAMLDVGAVTENLSAG
jgi:hypothetical protein